MPNILLPEGKTVVFPVADLDAIYNSGKWLWLSVNDWILIYTDALDWTHGRPSFWNSGLWWLTAYAGMYDTVVQKAEELIKTAGQPVPTPVTEEEASQEKFKQAVPWIVLIGGFTIGTVLLAVIAKEKFKE